jgi:sporulation protein YlmC with PRC-barrel domain
MEFNSLMTTNQFENSRVSGPVPEATLRSENPVSPEISNMIAEGGPASPEVAMSVTGRLAAASTLMGTRVLKSPEGEELGHIEEIMLDVRTGWISYAVLSFTGFPGIVDQRFPVPWNALRIDRDEFILDLDRQTLEGAPHFPKDNWPDMADPAFGRLVHKHYGTEQYWQHTEPTTGYQAGLRH